MNSSRMKNELNQICKQAHAAKVRLKQKILSLPDSAEGVTMLSQNCCTVPFSLIGSGKSWGPSYWLTKGTKNELISMIDSNRSIDTIITSIEAVLTTGKLNSGSRLPLNVLTALKEAWEG
jgi:hypothetical protein